MYSIYRRISERQLQLMFVINDRERAARISQLPSYVVVLGLN